MNRPPRNITFGSEGRGSSAGTSAGNMSSVFCALEPIREVWIHGAGVSRKPLNKSGTRGGERNPPRLWFKRQNRGPSGEFRRTGKSPFQKSTVWPAPQNRKGPTAERFQNPSNRNPPRQTPPAPPVTPNNKKAVQETEPSSPPNPPRENPNHGPKATGRTTAVHHQPLSANQYRFRPIIDFPASDLAGTIEQAPFSPPSRSPPIYYGRGPAPLPAPPPAPPGVKVLIESAPRGVPGPEARESIQPAPGRQVPGQSLPWQTVPKD